MMSVLTIISGAIHDVSFVALYVAPKLLAQVTAIDSVYMYMYVYTKKNK